MDAMGVIMEDKTSFRLSPYIFNLQSFYILLTTVLLWTSSLLYQVSLRGGSLGYIESSIPTIVLSLLLSTLLMITVTAVTVHGLKRVHIISKAVTMVCGWTIFIHVVISDTETTMLHHGYYNLSFFLPVFVLSQIVIAVCVLLWKLSRSLHPALCWGCVLTLSILTLTTWIVVSHSAYQSWNQGVLSSLEMTWPLCSLDLAGTPWLSILPTRTINFICKALHSG